MVRAFAAVAVLFVLGCNVEEESNAPDASCEVEPAACVDEGNEDCESCWHHIGDCCYGDQTILGKVDPLIAVCRNQASCQACCNECVALSCDDWKMRNMCPDPPASQPGYVPPDASAAMGNGWTVNAWSNNGYGPLQALRDSLLDDATLDEKRFNDLLATDSEVMFIKYLIQCALPTGAFVRTSYNNMPLVFEGSLGLAPDWAKRTCDVDCQEWVTACMFARNSYYGIPVALSVRGPHPALSVSAEEVSLATVEEGAFFGNMFSDPWVGYSCRGSGDDPISTIVRRCTFADPGAGYQGAPPTCWFFEQGAPCDKVCTGRGPNGELLECHGTLGDGGPPAVFSHPITVYMKHSEIGALPPGCP